MLAVTRIQAPLKGGELQLDRRAGQRRAHQITCRATSPTAKASKSSQAPSHQISRRTALGSVLLASPFLSAASASASGVPESAGTKKGLSPEEIKAIVEEDLVKRQFLATANFSPEIYSPNCTFTDEIDSYGYADFVKGTQALFDSSESTVRLVGDVEASDQEVSLRFSEELAFNVPFKPKTTLSGKLTLTRDSDGLISAYKETWDQSVPDVLRTVHFSKQFQ